MINPLRAKQIDTLNRINCDDLARKIQELVEFCNMQYETNQDLGGDVHALITEIEKHIQWNNQQKMPALNIEPTKPQETLEEFCEAEDKAYGWRNKKTKPQDKCKKKHFDRDCYECKKMEDCLDEPQEKETPMGISQWLAHGRKYGYDKYHDKCEHEGEKYNELIMAVENKYWGETRHQTALRLIKEAQSSSFTAKSDKLQTK